ncbi:MAG: two-component regulator propeller domain-containing protein [Pyrinomonadaceae bacterium]
MEISYRSKTVAFGILIAIAGALLTDLIAQSIQPSPSPSGTPSASPSPSPANAPVRTPSPTPLPGAQNFHRWGSITVFNGLPSDAVKAIAQTSDGVMWFGTDNGLARFDGRRIQNYSLGEAGSNRILVLKTALTGHLWIGTENGAFVYSDGRFSPVGGTQNAGVTAILLADSAYLGTDTGRILRVTGEGNTLSAETLRADAILSSNGSPFRVTGLTEIDGKLLAATWGDSVYAVGPSGYSALQLAPRPIYVNSLANVGGRLVLGTDAPRGVSGLFAVEGGERAVRVTAPTATVLTLGSNDGGVWAGTERYGLFHVVGSKLEKVYTFENTSGGLRSNTIYTIFTDREGVIWAGTNRGVSRFDRHGPLQQTVSDIPNSNFIRTLYKASDGRIYAGSNRGLFYLNGENWLPISGYANRAIFALSEGSRGKLLVGAADRPTDAQETEGGGANTRSYADLKGRKFAAVFGLGLVELGPAGSTLRVAEPTISAMSSSKDKLWFGTANKGLFSFDGTSATAEFSAEVLKSGMIRRIVEAPDGTLWIAGEHGVFSVRDGVSERLIEVEDVRDIYVSNGQIWAATTTRGLQHARYDERFGWLVSTIGFEQGLPSEKAFSILPMEVGMLIATNRGVVTYRPGTVPPKIIATRVLSQRVHDLTELRNRIDLEYPQNSLLVEVAGQSSRTFPEEFQYAFLLKRADGELVDSRLSSDPQYAPADLEPGSYTIEAQAFDRALLPSEPLIINFAVAKAPFPWTATALGVLLVIAIIALIWAIIERRQIARSNRELALARSDLANEAERERSRIARDLHDQTLADLRDLMMMSDRLTPANPEFRAEIEAVSTEIRRICEDLSPSVLENVGLVSALEFLLTRSVKNHRFHTSEDANELIRFPLIVQLHIYRIAQEVVTNIERHSDAGLVEMNVEVSADGGLYLTIADDGTAFDPDTTSNSGRGISNIRSRANIIGAEIAWKPDQPTGNLFELRIKPRKV